MRETILKRWVDSGTQRVHDEQERQRIRITNLLAMLITALAVMYIFILGALAGVALGTATAIIMVCFAVIPALNERGYTRVARCWLSLLLTGVLVSYGGLFLGKPSGAHYMFFAAMVIPPLTFSTRDRALLAITTAIPVIGLILLVAYDFSSFGMAPLVDQSGQRIIELTLVPTSAGSLLLGVLYFARASETSQQALNARNRDLTRIFDNVDQGLLSLDREGRIDPERSAIVDRWLGEIDDDTTFADALAHVDADAARSFAAAWKPLRTGTGGARALAALPTEASDGEQHFELRYLPIGGDGWERLMVIMSDVTADREREAQRERQRQSEERELVARARVAEQLQIARDLQLSILPRDVAVPGLDIAYSMIPAEDVGGDYVDVRPSNDGTWVAVGDVSGHGISAGVTMFMIQSAMAAICGGSKRPSQVVRQLNDVLYENIRLRRKADDYVTFVAAHISREGRLRYSGGHLDILVLRRRTRALEVVHTRGAWIGAYPDIDHALFDDELVLEEGDLVVLYTDGVTEAMNEAREQFGPERLHALVAEAVEQDTDVLLQKLLDALAGWTKRDVADDDITVVALRYEPQRGDVPLTSPKVA